MLVLEREVEQSIIIGGNIVVKILAIRRDGRRVKIGIDAPKDILVVREELLTRDNKR